MSMNNAGKLGDRLVADVIRDAAQNSKSGLLSLSRVEVTKGIYFEAGTPVSAISSLPEEQLEARLVEAGHASSQLIDCAKLLCSPQPIGRYLIERDLIREDIVSRTARELSLEISLSLFDWEEGEYALDEAAQHNGERSLECSAADLIAIGARQAAGNPRLAEIIAPDSQMVEVVGSTECSFTSSVHLNSVESYILSGLTAPTVVSDIASHVGLSEDESRRAVCVLLGLGLLKKVGENQEAEAISSRPNDAVDEERPQAPFPEAQIEATSVDEKTADLESGPPETLEETISRQLQSLEASDYYHVLGVDRDATAEAIGRAHGELEQMFDFYKALYPDDKKLNKRLDSLSEKIRLAKLTLTDPNLRLRYETADLNPSVSREPKPTENKIVDSPNEAAKAKTFVSVESAEEQQRAAASAQVIPLVQSIPAVTASVQIPAQPAVTRVEPVAKPRRTQKRQGKPVSAEQVAHHNYSQGRARYDQKDVHAAEHLFREAVRLNPNEPNHHYYLALTLIILSQAHHGHTHDKGCHVTCNLGGALMSNPRLRYEAAKHLEKAGELSPFNSQVPLRLGLLFKEANLARKARQYFRRTLELDPKNEIALREARGSGSTGPLEPLESFGGDFPVESNSKSARSLA